MISSELLSVHIAGSDYLTLVGLRDLLDRSGIVRVAGSSDRGTEAIQYVAAQDVDVLLMDTSISNHGLLETMTAISRMERRPQTILLSPQGTRAEEVAAAFRAGASGHLVRGPGLEDAAAAIRILHRGGLHTSAPALPAATVHPEAMEANLLERFCALRPLDLRIIDAVVHGSTNAAIARRMHVSEATVKSRLAQIMNQLGVDNRVQIAVVAVRARFAKIKSAG